MSTFRVGQRVVLPANKKEGWPREEARILGTSGKGMYIVDVGDGPDSDDGIREVHKSGIRPMRRKQS